MQIEKPAATNEKNLTTDVKSRIHKLKLCRSGRSATTAYCSNLKARETMDISQAESLNLIRRVLQRRCRYRHYAWPYGAELVAIFLFSLARDAKSDFQGTPSFRR